MNIPRYEARLEESLDRDNPLEAFRNFQTAVNNGVRIGADLTVRLYHSLAEMGGGNYVPAQLQVVDTYMFRRRS